MIPKERIKGLDLMRSIAILLVIINHSIFLLQPLEHHLIFKRIFPASIPIGIIMGTLGVDMFFALSGFLIGSILVKTYLNTKVFSFKTLTNFWIRRWMRTLPNYYLILLIWILFIVFNFHLNFTKVLLIYFLFLQNLFYPHGGFFGESWSLAVEEWFYISFPLAIYIFNKTFNPSNKKVFLLKVIFFYIIIFIVFKIINASTNYITDLDEIRQIVIFKLDSIAYGVLISFFMLDIKAKSFLTDNRTKLFLISLICICIICFLYYLCVYKASQNDFYKSKLVNFSIKVFYYSLLPFLFSLMLPFFCQIKISYKNWVTKSITHISLISYSLYLLNLPLEEWIFKQMINTNSPIIIVVINYLSYWVVLFLSATFLYKFYENPMTNLRDKISSEKL